MAEEGSSMAGDEHYSGVFLGDVSYAYQRRHAVLVITVKMCKG
jgi:hypothetical protein